MAGEIGPRKFPKLMEATMANTRDDAPARIARIIRENLSGPMFDEPEIQSDHEADIMRTAELIVSDLCASGQHVRSLDPRIYRLNAEALAEIKAVVDGESDQPVADIISGLLDEIAALTPAPQPEGQMERAKHLALQAIDAMPGAGPFTEEGREDDWRFRARLARKEALDAARAHIALAFDKGALIPEPIRAPDWKTLD